MDIEDIITRYIAVDMATHVVSGIIGVVNGLADAISSTIKMLSDPSAWASAGGFVGLAGQAVQAHAEIESLRVVLTALAGSAQLADEKLAFIRKLDAPSPFTFSQLAEAGVMLENFGLRIERVLPLVAELGAPFHDMVHLQEAVRVFGEIAGGTMPNIRQLASIGLNKQSLLRAGVIGDDEKLISDTNLALERLEALIHSKYGNMLEDMQSTTTSKMASVASAWQKMMAKIGEFAAQYLNPVLDRIVDFLNKLSQPEKMQRFLTALMNGIHAVAEAMKVVIALFTALVTGAIVAGIMRMIIVLGGLVMELILAASWAAVLDALMENLPAIIAGVVALTAGIMAFRQMMDFLNKTQKGLQGLLNKPLEKDPNAATDLTGTGSFLNDPNLANSSKQTAENTGIIARNTADFTSMLRRYVVGGGPLAQIGLTPVELARHRAGHSDPIRIQFTGRRGSADSWFVEMVEQIVREMQRQGQGRQIF